MQKTVQALHEDFEVNETKNAEGYQTALLQTMLDAAAQFGRDSCIAARKDSGHILSIAAGWASALESRRSTLAVAGVLGAGKTRSLTFLLAWLALHLGNARRLQLVLASQTLLYPAERLLFTSNHWVYGSGLLFGYASHGRTVPDWLVIPDSAQPNAWRLLHYAGKGGARFSVGSNSRYPPGQESEAAQKAKEYQFEALRKIYFYDAWRSQPELGTRGSDLHLPP